MNRVEQHLSHKLEERTQAGNLRALPVGRQAIDFFSNDYLGLATTGLLQSLVPNIHTGQSTGSTGSRLLSGNNVQTEELETLIASFHKAEAALLFNSGYDANVGLLSCIPSRHTTILYDELCHASIIDGVRLSQCTRKYKFGHNDVHELEEQLKKYSEQGPLLVVVESVYSMDGDMAPLTELVALCETHDAQLIVDEAHATGVFGNHGEGLVCLLNLQDRVFARVHTFGKALGCHGAVVVGSTLLQQYLINFARSFIYTTALPGHSVAAIKAAYDHLAGNGFSNKALHDLIDHFRMRIQESGNVNWRNSRSAIQALVIGDNGRCKEMATRLQQAGLQVNPILQPTVPVGMERLRVCLHTFNTTEEVDMLFECIRNP